MFIDLTLEITKDFQQQAFKNEKMAFSGHVGTHFDVMNKTFPLEYLKRKGIIFDVRDVRGRDIAISDIDAERIGPDMFVAFYTGYMEEETYGSRKYFSQHPQLADELIDMLIEKKTSIIGIDCAGVRRGKEHTPKDQYCADAGFFIVENLCNLRPLAGKTGFSIYTFPLSYQGMTGLPCRVAAELVWFK